MARPEAFEKHSKLCTKKTPGGPVGMKKFSSFSGLEERSIEGVPVTGRVQQQPSMDAPRVYRCYLCDNQYGSKRQV